MSSDRDPLRSKSSDPQGYGTLNNGDTVNANDSSINARNESPEDDPQKRQDFMQLLRDTPWVSSHSSWQVTKDALNDNPRYIAVGDDALSEKWFNEFRQILGEGNAEDDLRRKEVEKKRQGFMQLLRGTLWVNSQSSWQDTKDTFNDNPRCTAVGDDALSVKWFNEFRQNLGKGYAEDDLRRKEVEKKRQDFMQLLRDTLWVSSRSSWQDTKDALDYNPRYTAVGDDDLSEEWFNEFRQILGKGNAADDLRRKKVEKKRQYFMRLLLDCSWVHSRSSWQVTKNSLKSDQIFPMEIKALLEGWFYEFRKNLKRQNFIQLLRKTPEVNSRSSWHKTRETLKADQRFSAVEHDALLEEWFSDVEDALLEKWFNGFVQNIKREDFMQLLRDSPWVHSQSSWEVTHDALKCDPRFKAVGDDTLMEKWFNEFRQNLIHCHMDEKGDNNTRLKFLICLLVFSPLKWYRGTLWISVPHVIVFFIHLAKLVFITCGVFQFGKCREQLSDHITHGQLVIKHNMLKDWSADYETLLYPPSIGPFAVYKVKDFIDRINFAVEGYYNMEYEATGHFKILPLDQMNLNLRYIVVSDSILETKSTSLEPKHGLTNVTEDGHVAYKYDVLKELEYYNLTDIFYSILDATLSASLHSFRVLRKGGVMCLQIQIDVGYNDIDFDGEVDIELQTLTTTVECQRMNIKSTDAAICEGNANWLHGCVLAFTILMFVYDFLSVIFGLAIMCYYNHTTNIQNFWPYLLRWWSLVSLIGESFIFKGESMIQNENSKRAEQKLRSFDEIAFFYGIGCLFCWIGFMRHLKINRKFSLLFHTIYHAKSNIMAFLLCTGTLFVGYWTCAYVTLGVYHPKFETEIRAAVSLFSLMYGDDIFGTVTSVHYENAGSEDLLKASVIIVIFSFVILFTLLALNLIIALINTSYTTIYEIEENCTAESMETFSMFWFLNREETHSSHEGIGIGTWVFGKRYYYRYTTLKDLKTSCQRKWDKIRKRKASTI